MAIETKDVESANQDVCRKLVQREVIACVSVLVSELMEKQEHFPEYMDDLMDLGRKMPTVEDLLDSAGYQLVEDSCGEYYALTNSDAETYKSLEIPDDSDENEVKDEFLIDNGTYISDPEDASEVADELGLDAYDYESEVLEHWIVSSYFADKLASKGETVREIFNLNIWGRTTSGQAILLDGVIREIASDMEILHGQANHSYWAD